MDSVLWVMLLAALALLVRVGQTIAGMGVARAKNVASAGLRSIADLCIATLCFWAIGAAILFQQNNGLFGFDLRQLIGWGGLSANWFAMLALVLIATGIVAPALAERSRLIVPLSVGALLAGLLVPMVMHWTLRGWLDNLQFIDDAQAAAIHFAPALAAATAAFLVGPRDGKFNRDGSSNMIPGHSILMIIISLLIMLVGWVGYVVSLVPGAASIAAANLMVAAAAGGLVSLIVGHIRYGKADVLLTCGGILGGMVSITAPIAHVGTPAAFLIGAVAGFLIPWATVMMDVKLRLDDPGGMLASHAVGGAWSLLAAAIFPNMTIAEHFKALGIQLLGMLVVAIMAIALCGLLLSILRIMAPLRSKESDEYDGLDLAEHDINAHPDFQQTMIKSYHLREA